MTTTGSGNSPKTWAPPNTKPFELATVRAGEWIVVELNYRDSNTSPMAYLPGFFLAHVLYTPNADDGQPQPGGATGGRLQPVMYGGTADKQRSEYRIDPGFAFQVPWDGRLAIVAGGDSPPDVIVDVTIKRGFQPEGAVPDMHGPYGPSPGFSADDPSAFLQLAVEEPAMMELALEDPTFTPYLSLPRPDLDAGPMKTKRSRRVYPPPVIGSPGLVPCTYVSVVPNAGIPFPSGVTSMEAFDFSGIPSNPILIAVNAMGNTLPFYVQNGCTPRTLGPLAQGGGAANTTPAVWSPFTFYVGPPLPPVLASLTVWSRLGN